MEEEQNGQATQGDGQGEATREAGALSSGGEGDGYTPPRDTSGRFLPGYSGNPHGRPKGSISFRTRFRRTVRENPEDDHGRVTGREGGVAVGAVA
jgi:hypothetical protein